MFYSQINNLIQLNDKMTKDLAQKELEYFFYQGESDLGVKSNFHFFILACKYSTKTDAEIDLAYQEALNSEYEALSQSVAAERYNKIFHIYKQLSSKSKIIFEEYYDSYQKYNKDIIKAFKNYTNLIFYTNFNQKNNYTKYNLIEPTDIQLKNILSNKQFILTECEKLYNYALDEFTDLWNLEYHNIIVK